MEKKMLDVLEVAKDVWTALHPSFCNEVVTATSEAVCRDETLFKSEDESGRVTKLSLSLDIESRKVRGGSPDFESCTEIYSVLLRYYAEGYERGDFDASTHVLFRCVTAGSDDEKKLYAARALVAYRKFRAFYSNLDCEADDIEAYLPREC